MADIAVGIGGSNDCCFSAHQPHRSMVDGTISDMAAVCNLPECGNLAAESLRWPRKEQGIAPASFFVAVIVSTMRAEPEKQRQVVASCHIVTD